LIIEDRELFLSNAIVIAGGFIFMSLTGLRAVSDDIEYTVGVQSMIRVNFLFIHKGKRE